MSKLKPRRCQHSICKEPAIYLAGLMLSAGRGEPAPIYFDIALCPLHARTTGVRDLVTDEAWTRLVESMRWMGKAGPIRKLTRVRHVRIDHAPEEFRKRYEPSAKGDDAT